MWIRGIKIVKMSILLKMIKRVIEPLSKFQWHF